MKNRSGSVINNKVINKVMKMMNPALMTIFDPILSTIHPKTKTEPTIVNKGIPAQSVPDFKATYNKEAKLIEFTVPKMYLFQNLMMFKFGLAMDLQNHMEDEISDVKFVEIYEKMPIPQPPSESVMNKVEEFNKQQEEESVE